MDRANRQPAGEPQVVESVRSAARSRISVSGVTKDQNRPRCGPVHLEVLAATALDARGRSEIIHLCEAAYGESFAHLFNDLPDSVHILARDDSGLLVSHVEWVPRWLQPAGHGLLRTAYVEAVATSPERQRLGLATALLRRFDEIVRDVATWELAALSPSDSSFYARLGWELWQGPLAIRRDNRVDPTPPGEEVMILRLPRTPATLVTTSLLTAEWRVGELW
jgi:aminoglycoside 2'-N-acetyltransferase I